MDLFALSLTLGNLSHPLQGNAEPDPNFDSSSTKLIHKNGEKATTHCQLKEKDIFCE